MQSYDEQYKNVIRRIMEEGAVREDRTGVGTLSVFDVNLQARLDYDVGVGRAVLPATTLRKVFPRTAFHELFWMLRGSTDVTELQKKNIKIWDGNSSRTFLDNRGLNYVKENHVPKAYGHQFRRFNGHYDQLFHVLNGIRNSPDSRRHMISLWNPTDLDDTPLPPCHVLYNFYVMQDTLHLKFFQRSSDFILAGNQNMMFASMFLQFVAGLMGMEVGSVAHSITDCHIYMNHISVAEELLDRELIDHVASFKNPFVDMAWDGTVEDLDDILNTMFYNESIWEGIAESLDYKSHPPIARDRLIMAI